MPAHPEDELLADLAADVLPIDAARQVEAHVIGCARCSQVLASAESIRGLLRQAPPEAMPPQVMARLEQALTAVRQGRQPQPMPRRAAGPMGAAGLPGALGVPGAAPPANAPLRRDARTGRTGPQSQPTPHIPPAPPRPPQPVRSEHPAEPELPGKGAQPAPNTSSYTVRPFKPKTTPDTVYPPSDATTVQPAFRDEGPDPELTQPVRKRRSRPAAPAPETSGMTQLMRPIRDRPPGKLTRMDSTQAVRVRRQAMEEQKADEPSRWPRISPQIAAAVVLVLALAGGLVFWQARGGGSSADDASSTASAGSASAPLLATVQQSGTKYQKADLKSQVDQLVSRGLTTPASPDSKAAADSGNTTLSAQSQGKPKASGEQSGSAAESSGATDANAELLESPKALAACLKAIGHEGEQPVAVDLATYNDREAAILVLPGTGGGYDVWSVARTCQPGNDGTVDVVEVKS